MKFSCDNCGAQYLIADEKLGRRGVKVRCKKCTYVIIVRPPGFEEKKARKAGVSRSQRGPKADGMAGDSPSLESLAKAEGGSASLPDGAPAPQDDRAALGPHQDALGRGPLAVPAGEAGARGFDPAAGLDLELERGPAPGEGDNGLGASVPEHDQTEEETRVDHKAVVVQSPERVFGQRDETRIAAAPGATGRPTTEELGRVPHEDALGRVPHEDALAGPPKPSEVENRPFGAWDSVPPASAADPADRALPASAAKSPATASHEGGIGQPAPLPQEFEIDLDGQGSEDLPPQDAWKSEGLMQEKTEGQTSGLGEDAASAPPKDEFREMQSSLEGELAGLSGDVQAASAKMIAAASNGKLAAPTAERGPEKKSNDPNVAAEIGNAFAQMFGSDEDDTGIEPADPRLLQPDIASPSISNGADSNGPAANEWYVAIDDEQVGPVDFEALRTKWQTGAVGPNSLAWRHGMNDWTAIREIEELSALHGAPADPPVALNADPAESQAEKPRAEVTRSSASRSEAVSVTGVSMGGAMATVGGGDDIGPAWKPSAASALASLAAEEMAAPSPPPAKPATDIKAGPALPATTDALERLLEGELDTRATAFGAAELSESRVRPLPRRVDAVTSVPLRDPTGGGRASSQWGLVGAIIAGFMLLGLIVVVGLYVFVRPQGSGITGPSPAETLDSRNGAPGVAAQGVERTAEAQSSAAADGAGPAKAAGLASAAAAKSAVPADAGTAPQTLESGPKTAAKAPPRRPRRRRTTSSKRATPASASQRSGPTRSKPVVVAPPPPRAPPPPPTIVAPPPAGDLSEDSLINPTGARRAPPPPRTGSRAKPSLPTTLDETDILGVLRKNRMAVRDCLSRHAASGSSASGTMTVYMVVRQDGRPTRISVSPQFRSTVAGTCIVDTVKRWRFPRFSGENLPVDFPVNVRGG